MLIVIFVYSIGLRLCYVHSQHILPLRMREHNFSQQLQFAAWNPSDGVFLEIPLWLNTVVIISSCGPKFFVNSDENRFIEISAHSIDIHDVAMSIRMIWNWSIHANNFRYFSISLRSIAFLLFGGHISIKMYGIWRHLNESPTKVPPSSTSIQQWMEFLVFMKQNSSFNFSTPQEFCADPCAARETR